MSIMAVSTLERIGHFVVYITLCGGVGTIMAGGARAVPIARCIMHGLNAGFLSV